MTNSGGLANANVNITKKLTSIKTQLNTNPNYNKTDKAKSLVSERIDKWSKMLAEMNENNFESIEASIIIEMSQLEKDLFTINSQEPEFQTETIKKAMQEAQALGGAQKSPEQAVSDNVSKLEKTRQLMAAAGL